VVQFLSSSWAEAFNTALEGAVIPGPDADAGLAAVDGTFAVVQEVRGGPEGDVRVILQVADGSLRLQVQHPGEGDGGGGPGLADDPSPEVTVAISYLDAVAMSKGDLTAAEALNSGRIRVRGDLSVLVAAQQMLMAARSSTRDVVASTTY
jgi:hypothetical protein